MPGHEFVDSNIWLYALMRPVAAASAQKQQRAEALLRGLKQPVINSQVVREVCHNMLRKSGLDEAGLQELIQDFYARCTMQPSSAAQHLLASQLRQTHALSFWDSLIVAAALDAGCTTLYSEDMQHGQRIADQLTIVNPLLAAPVP
jgi:predicted nucleic acid-binding protein